MKKLVIGLLVAAAACQPQAKYTAKVEVVSAPAKTPKALTPSPAAAAAKVETVENPVRDFLAANNLAPLWQADFKPEAYSSLRPTILDGFYGAEHRHIAFIFDHVTQDAANPTLFRVRGRSRFRKNVTSFDGSIIVQTLKPLKVFLDLDSVEEARVRAYTATAHFVLNEDPHATGAGVFKGTALLDFYISGAGKPNRVQILPDKELPTGGSGQLFRGQWQSNRTSRQQAVAFATYADAVLPGTMTDLFIGDRGEGINPKYAKLDWSETWENDEWWAKSPKPSLSL